MTIESVKIVYYKTMKESIVLTVFFNFLELPFK